MSLALLAGWLALGCASDLVRSEDGYRHTRHHDSAGAPRGPGPAWQEIDRGEGTFGLILHEPTLDEELKLLVVGANRSGVVRTMIRMLSLGDE